MTIIDRPVGARSPFEKRKEARFRTTLAGLVMVAGFLSAGCELIARYETFEAEPPPPPHDCDGIQPPNKANELGVQVLTKETGGNCFWIDQSEITVAQYSQYLQDQEPAWPAECSWKGAASDPWGTPDDECARLTDREDRPGEDTKPIRCVDWCDALSFCKWANKRLCGTNPHQGVTSAGSTTYWDAACSVGGSGFPYGGTKAQHQACNIGLVGTECNNLLKQSGDCGPVSSPSPKLPRCASPNGVWHMIGNVAEWADDCGLMPAMEPANQPCQVKGGSFADDDENITCKTRKYEPRAKRDPSLGFRCCAGLEPEEEQMKLTSP